MSKKKPELNIVKRWMWKNARGYSNDFANIHELLKDGVEFKKELNYRTVETLKRLEFDTIVILEDDKGVKYLRIIKFLSWMETHELKSINPEFLKQYWVNHDEVEC